MEPRRTLQPQVAGRRRSPAGLEEHGSSASSRPAFRCGSNLPRSGDTTKTPRKHPVGPLRAARRMRAGSPTADALGRDGSTPTSTQRTPADTADIRWCSPVHPWAHRGFPGGQPRTRLIVLPAPPTLIADHAALSEVLASFDEGDASGDKDIFDNRVDQVHHLMVLVMGGGYPAMSRWGCRLLWGAPV